MWQILAIPRDALGMVWHHRASQAPRHAAMHRHDELELNLVIGGRARYTLEGHWYDLGPRSLVWLFPGQEHLLIDCSDDFQMWIAAFQPELLQRHLHHGDHLTLTAGDPGHRFNRVLSQRAFKDLDRLCHELIGLRGDHGDAGLAWLLLQAWQAFRAHETEAERGALHPALTRLLSLLNHGGDDSLAALAATIGLSPTHLSRLCTAQLGCRFTVLRNRHRLDRAVFLQRQHPEATLLTTALAAGFGSYAQFHRACLAIHGQSPRRLFDWRANQPA